jgi:hypothetical protein
LQSPPHVLVRRQAGDVLAVHQNRALNPRLSARPVGDRVDQSRFAGAIGADDRRDRAGLDDQPVDSDDATGAVGDAQIPDFEPGAHAAFPR